MAAIAGLRVRPLGREDQLDLWNWLHIALWDPPPAPLRPRAVLDAPHVRLPPGIGLASVDGHTPQLGIALLPEFQGKGLGGELMAAALRAAKERGYRQVSLTVHPQNPAVGLYQRHAFEKRGLRNTYHLMVAKLG